MKTNKLMLVLLMLCAFGFTGMTQVLTPDVDKLSERISQKQIEIKERVLNNIVVKNIKTTNYTTYNTIYNLVDILTTEKNKTILTQDVISEVSDYAITYALADYFIKNELTLPSVESFSSVQSTGIYEMLDGGYKASNKTNFFRQEDLEIKDSISSALLANYIIDTLNSLLSESTYLKSKGFFKDKPLVKRFRNGLDVDYKLIKESGQEGVIVGKLKKFVSDIDARINGVDEVLSFIKESGKNMNDLKSLDKDDIGFILKLFKLSLDKFRDDIGKNSFIAKIGDIITTYVIFEQDLHPNDPEKIYSFKLDVEAIILALEDEFYESKITSLKNRDIGVKPFFGIGINYGFLTNDASAILNSSGTSSIYQMAYASEKIGLKFVFADYAYTRSHRPLEWFKYRGSYRMWKGPVKDPLIDDFYGMIFASGMLYNVVDLKSEENYNYGMLGAGLGVTFFNDLEMNVSYTVPMIKDEDSFENGMINLGFDIPIFEYLKMIKSDK